MGFVKRKLTIRIGIVPITKTAKAAQQAAVVYHLLETYGLSSVFAYLETAFSTKTIASPSKSSLDSAIAGRTPRGERIARSLEDILKSEDYQEKIQRSKNWIQRLSADSKIPPIFIDGVAIPRDDNYLQLMSTRVTADLQTMQAGIYNGAFDEDAYLPSYFLAMAAKKRNALLIPDDEKSLKIFDVNTLFEDREEIFSALPHVEADPSSEKETWAHMTLITDLDSVAGVKLLTTAVMFCEANPSVELIIVHNPPAITTSYTLSNYLFAHSTHTFKNANELIAVLAAENSAEKEVVQEDANQFWHTADDFIKSLSLQSGESAVLVNGRLVGPLPETPELDQEDFEQLLAFERSKRITPAYKALDALSLSDKLTSPLAAAKISSIIAISTISDAAPGIHEQPSLIRITLDQWNSSSTVIEVGDLSSASIQMTLLLDPASELGQRWIPILKVLSELDGIHIKIFLNPKERLQELPVKRFYRYVMESKPTFNENGALLNLGASFSGVPQEALLTLALDVPPAWLVAPKEAVHDLDNIKLSSAKTDVDALYELEYILIEGHSRETPGSAAPRGAQLVLGTERDPHFADTIIMANLGYFQFKANPGFYNIYLQEGRSSEIYQIDSVGSQGWNPVIGDTSTEVVLMSFQGATLYPRLSRKAGMEEEDVLEAKTESPLDFVSRGLTFAQGIIGGKGKDVADAHADINIFSVASGHLYERMLNIMMVSVMKHTKHTVKFWFIEQFLSPSFKDALPYLAAEYGFRFEMVTYKWPHWLRAQTEKQREIWGYKILFLDVLFPLSLDKVIFVDADQIVRTDMIELVNHNLQGAPYGFTPMCDSRTEMEGFRFWKQGYWEKFLRGLPYHISALYVVDLKRFRQMAAGDRLRQQYHQLSADPNSLSNLDQDLPNHMQTHLPIHSLPQEWLWCETWCSDESLKDAKTIDLCNNPLTKEPKLDRARRQVPEWTVYDDEIAAVQKKRKIGSAEKNTKSRTLEAEVTSKKDEL
jgi:UDP-glucose:glycoprotein glucosyltransferase